MPRKQRKEETPVNRDEIPEGYRFAVSLTADHTIIRDENGTLRYKRNPLIVWLQEQIDLNEMWRMYRLELWSTEQMMQFYRDIGYSLSGFEEVFADELDEMEDI